ncbi:HD domain-containing protein [bacterium]|nr:HD domain-containing protein [bacterium]
MEEKIEDTKSGASLFGRNLDLMNDDPLEEIFALNLGNFLSEYLISDNLAEKIKKAETNKKNDVEKLKEQLNELVSIYSLDNTLCVLGFNSKEDYIIYNSIAKTITQILDVDACHVYLTKNFAKGLDVQNYDLILVGSSVNFKDDIYKEKIGYNLLDDNFITEAFTKKEIVEINNFKESNLKPNKLLSEENVELLLSIPMNNNAYNVGVIVIESYSKKTFKHELKNLIISMARLFATSMSLQEAIEEVNNLLEDEKPNIIDLQHMRAELTALIGDLGDEQQNFVTLLAKAVDAKGEYKVAHSEMTADLSRKICKQLKLNEKTSDLIYYAGLLQNVGKITLSENLFNHNGKLKKEDWEKLQNHPNVGVNLLMNINFLSEVIPYIHYHKERWDGCGEPEGLKGMSIPLGSRIIALADAYMALISERPFRKALQKDEALRVLSEESGIKWDPAIYKALIEVV